MTKLSLVFSACREPDVKESSVPDTKKMRTPWIQPPKLHLSIFFIKKNCIIYNVKGVTHSIEPTNNFQPTLPLSSTKCFSVFELIVLFYIIHAALICCCFRQNNTLYTTCPASNNREKKGYLADILEYLATEESHIFLRNLWRQKQSWPETQHQITVNAPPCVLDM